MYKPAGKIEAMSRAQKSLQLFLLPVGWRDIAGERTDAFAAGEIFGGGKGAFRHMLAGTLAVIFANLCGA